MRKVNELEAEAVADLGDKGRLPFSAVAANFLKESAESYTRKHKDMNKLYVGPQLGEISAWSLSRDDVRTFSIPRTLPRRSGTCGPRWVRC
jgi:hypothetical protein